ncbi:MULTISPECIES: MlaA family lipoprotein [Ruegeria]|uniref:MlaA family lipoprotein n=1 Tax=Ruegeria TaxID=97050 RepID=UPI00147C4918|nr:MULTISPECIES: VacJ family lipoprotein [Ruegeria]MBY6083088.1 VacJ family lipoprotein [Ruegeria arenilitoris]UWR09169.1 VacJ family lipoprotein [Ruegeria sp. B32]
MSNRIRFKHIVAVSLFAVLSACASQPQDAAARGEVFDPYENANRGIHKFNLGVDRFLFRPASKGYVKIVPDPMVTSFNNFAENISLPGQAVDYLLQGNLKQSGNALLRFVINSTVGGFGLSKPADELNLPPVDTDFGETLHVWGFGEGAYVELPFYGPSTTRDAVGVVVNLFSNPINFSPTRPADNLGVYAEVVRRMGDRGRFSDTVDSILYESADSYAQARLIYLQNRRFELARDDEDAYLGLYSDPYADTGTDPVRDPYLDPYEDPYEDPYAE